MRAATAVLCLASAEAAVWPPPQHSRVEGQPLGLAADFRFDVRFRRGDAHVAAEKAAAAVSRYAAVVDLLSPQQVRAPGGGVAQLSVSVASDDLTLSEDTRYDYNLTVGAAGAAAEAESVYGAMYAMESFVQLLEGGRLRHSDVTIRDAPSYQWRGLMIDSGRRFVPMPTVRNLLDTMAANKLNVLHLHASDMCRFGVESKLYPNLTAALTGIHAGHYSQADIADMIKYAGDRGIRVVPEFDLPGHSRGYIPIESEGIHFCSDAESRSQLYGDPHNSTYNVLTKLMTEMAGLFPDHVFNIGCDETSRKGPCTVESTFKLEREVLNYIAENLNKTTAGWEEVLFDANAARPDTIVDAWTRHKAADITKTGHKAIESSGAHFYFTRPAAGGAAGWKNCWYDIATNVPADQRSLLLGGEMSMWTDTYCYIAQCGSSGGSPPVGHQLFDPALDNEFGRSVAGMIWPRGFVAAASFWNFNSTADPSAPAFVDAIWRLNDQLTARGQWTCPTNCSCDQLTACGKPYIKPRPPQEGDAVGVSSCGAAADEQQRWVLSSAGKLALATNQSLCATAEGAKTYPLRLADCAAASTFARDHSNLSQLVRTGASDCVDLKSDGTVGTWTCGSGQPNQQWAVDATSGQVVSMSGNYQGDLGGQCLTAGAAAPVRAEGSTARPHRTVDGLRVQQCSAPLPASQRWVLTSDGRITPAGDSSQCVHVAEAKKYPLALAACTADDVFTHSAELGQLVHSKTGACLDLRSDGAVGTWDCGSNGQPNQRWAVDGTVGVIASQSNHYGGDMGGFCLTQ